MTSGTVRQIFDNHLPSRNKPPHRTWRSLLVVISLVLLAVLNAIPVQAQPAIELQTDTVISREGYLVLSWQMANPEVANMLLQQASSADFASNVSELTVPANGSHTITGLATGVYHFRAGSTVLGWSDTISVRVAHHSLVQAWSFFAVGFLLFMTLCVSVFAGAKSARRNTA